MESIHRRFPCAAICVWSDDVSASPEHASLAHETPLESIDATSQRSITDYIGHDSGINPETQESFDFSAFGGLIDGGPVFCAPGVQNRQQKATPQQLGVRPNYESMGHDQADTVPGPQATLPLTIPPVEVNPDNGTIM